MALTGSSCTSRIAEAVSVQKPSPATRTTAWNPVQEKRTLPGERAALLAGVAQPPNDQENTEVPEEPLTKSTGALTQGRVSTVKAAVGLGLITMVSDTVTVSQMPSVVKVIG